MRLKFSVMGFVSAYCLKQTCKNFSFFGNFCSMSKSSEERRGNMKKVTCILFAVFLAAGFLLCVFLPKAQYSDSERRKLASMPTFQAQNIWNGRFMTDFETYAVDTFPFRTAFRTLKAVTATDVFFKKDNNGIYVSDGFIAAVEYPFNEDSLNRAVKRFRYIYETYLTKNNKVFLSIIPDKNCFLAKDSGHLSMDYREFEEQMKQKMDFAQYISISELLEKDDYYKTDTHWRQEKIIDVAERLAQNMGTTLSSNYKLHTLTHDFYGVYYGQAALPLEPDVLQYVTQDVFDECYVYDGQNNKEIMMYDMEKAAGRDPYEMFLSGSLSLVTLNNPKAQEDKKLIVFRDSFGSSIAPLLISGYSQITLVDIRYIQPDYLGQFVHFDNCDVLFLYSTLVLNNSETLK